MSFPDIEFARTLSSFLSEDEIHQWTHHAISRLIVVAVKYGIKNKIPHYDVIMAFMKYMRELWFQSDEEMEQNINSRRLIMEIMNVFYVSDQIKAFKEEYVVVTAGDEIIDAVLDK